jgi:hypothetical protein
MIIIKFFSEWTTDVHIYNLILKQYNWDLDPNYNKLYKFTTESNYTHAILFNDCTPNLNIPKENVIGLTQEPFIYKKYNNYENYCKEHCKKFYVGNCNNKLADPFVEKYPYMLPMINFKTYYDNNVEKTKILNFVYSNKNENNPNFLYNYRHLLGENILQNYLPVDIYGGSTDNLKNYYNRINIKDSFDWENVHEIYKDYKFSIAIENCREPEYFSEKIIIPLLCGCVPIYLGCFNIDKYFKDYIIKLTGNIDEDIVIIKNILDNPDKYYKKIDVEKIQEIIHLKNLINTEFIEKV